MPRPSPAPAYSTDFDPRTGTAVAVAPGIVRVTAPNPGPYTFTGTNSFLLGEARPAVLDPGPEDEDHLKALLAAIGGRPVEAIILTHTHKDHCGLARRLMAATGAPLWSAGPHRLSRPGKWFEINPFAQTGDFALAPDRVLGDGEAVALDGLTLEVAATPGHCANHLSFVVRGSEMLLAGDHVMGWSSTVVAAPDGDLGDYLASLDKVIALPQTRYLPAHGGEIADGPEFAQALRAHRLMRNEQLLETVRSGPMSLGAARRAIYPGLSGRLAIGAGRMLLSHAEYLEREGRLRIERGLWGVRLLVPG